MTNLIRKICHTKCYKYEHLWEVGDVYEGEEDPGKHFSDDGINHNVGSSNTAGDDPRSNAELLETLKRDYNVTMPKNRPRKDIWRRLHELEQSAGKDALTTEKLPDTYTSNIGELEKPKRAVQIKKPTKRIVRKGNKRK